jgi:hypothetical protein
VPLWLWVLVAAKAEALTDRAIRAATATIMDFFMAFLLLCWWVEVDVTFRELLHTGSGLDLGAGSTLALGLGSPESRGAYGEGDEGSDGDEHGLFHGVSPFELCVDG